MLKRDIFDFFILFILRNNWSERLKYMLMVCYEGESGGGINGYYRIGVMVDGYYFMFIYFLCYRI